MQVMVYGTGRMAQAIARVMAADARFRTVLVSPDPDSAPRRPPAGTDLRIAGSEADLGRLLSESDAIIMAGESWAQTADIARLARRWGCHYLDVTENPVSAQAIAAIAEGADHGFAPGCGLAPGYVTALVAEELAQLSPKGRITAHVGVLPKTRTTRLGYGNIWGIDGLLVEYTQPCLALRDGECVALPPLSDETTITLGGERFESFTSAGSLDALVQANVGRVSGLVFKTLRYPGHLDCMRLLLEDLGLSKNRHLLRTLLMNGLPVIEEDRVMIALDIEAQPGAPVRRVEQHLDATQDDSGAWHSAGLAATAAHVCAVADLLCTGRLTQRGFLAQGSVPIALLRHSTFFAPLDARRTVPTATS